VRLLVDENLPEVIADMAREAGIASTWVRDVMPGAPDVEVLAHLTQSRETLVTRDVRFANHLFDRIAAGEKLSGVVLIRAQSMADTQKAWARFLDRPRQPAGIAVATMTGVRYRERHTGEQTP